MKLRKLLLCLSFGFLVTTTIDVYANETDVETPIIEEQEGIVDSSADEIQYGWDSTHSTYTKEDGTLAIGWTEIDGATYYFDQSGIMQINQWIEDKYIGPDGIMVTNQWVDDRYVDDSGNWVKNTFVYQDGWKYLYGDGSYAINKFEVIDGSTYYFNVAGYIVTGWQEINGYWYYFNDSGVMVTNNWIGNYYVLSDGRMATNQWIGNYYVGTDGNIVKNQWIENNYVDGSGLWQPNKWIYTNGLWWYRYGDGSYPSSRFEVIDGNTYYFNLGGYVVTGWYLLNEDWYYFNTSGSMIKNQWIGNYYVGPEGKMLKNQWVGERYVGNDGHIDEYKMLYELIIDENGTRCLNQQTKDYEKNCWRFVNGYYYFNQYGYALIGTHIVDDKTYHFDSSGKMITGLYEENGNKYWLNEYGQKSSGWKMIDGTWYYWYPDTFTLANSGWQQIGSEFYYFLTDGSMKTDWLLLNSSDWYYLGKDGACKTGIITIDNNSFYLYTKNDINGGSEGVMATNRTLNLGNITIYVNGSGYVYQTEVSNISYLSQKDSRWSNTFIGNYTIGSTGCVPTTSAMIINHYKGTNYTPVDIATKLYNAGYMNTPSYLGSNGNSFLLIKNEFGLSYVNNLSYNNLVGYLKAGKLVACAVGPGTFVGSGFTHEILLTGYNNGYVTVYDPLNPAKNGSYSLSSIWNQQSNDKDDRLNGGPFFAF